MTVSRIATASAPAAVGPYSQGVSTGQEAGSLVFVSGQVWEYATLVAEGMPISADSYASAFYITTGFHAIHVTGGLVAFLLVIGRAYAVKNFGKKEETSAIVVSYYWHFVDVVWVALFFVIYFLK